MRSRKGREIGSGRLDLDLVGQLPDRAVGGGAVDLEALGPAGSVAQLPADGLREEARRHAAADPEMLDQLDHRRVGLLDRRHRPRVEPGELAGAVAVEGVARAVVGVGSALAPGLRFVLVAERHQLRAALGALPEAELQAVVWARIDRDVAGDLLVAVLVGQHLGQVVGRGAGGLGATAAAAQNEKGKERNSGHDVSSSLLARG